MAIFTGRLIWIPPGVSVYATCDNLAETISDVTIDNLSDKPLTIIFTIQGRTREVTIPPGTTATRVLPPGPAAKAGDGIQISGVV